MVKSRKLHFVKEVLAISSEDLIDKLEAVLKKEQELNPDLKEKLISR